MAIWSEINKAVRLIWRDRRVTRSVGAISGELAVEQSEVSGRSAGFTALLWKPPRVRL